MLLYFLKCYHNLSRNQVKQTESIHVTDMINECICNTETPDRDCEACKVGSTATRQVSRTEQLRKLGRLGSYYLDQFNQNGVFICHKQEGAKQCCSWNHGVRWEVFSSPRWSRAYAFAFMHCNLNCALFLCDSNGIPPFQPIRQRT